MWRIKFLSTPSARRATLAVTAKRRKGNKFLSTPSARRATFWWADVPRICIEFLSTPSARRATEGGEYSRAGEWISIHALREEGDDIDEINDHIHKLFLSTPSARRATQPHRLCAGTGGISIHALREEGDMNNNTRDIIENQFLSTPSARRATSCQRRALWRLDDFYPRPPRGGRPLAAKLAALEKQISIHALREEGDA